MPIIPGIFEPGYNVFLTTGVASDSNAILAAATGRRVVGINYVLATTTVVGAFLYSGALVRGLNAANAGTAAFGTFALTTGGLYYNLFPGVDCSGGVSLDWRTGQWGVEVFYIDVS